MEQLARFAQLLHGESDPTRVLYQGQAQQIHQEDGAYVLTLALPFVSKDEVSLSQIGDELVVHVGNQKRNLILPRALVGAESEGAKLEGDRLTIRFRQPEAAQRR